MNHMIGIAIVGLCLSLAGPVHSKPLPWERGDRGKASRAEKMEQRIKAKRAELIRSRIGLSEAKSAEA